MAERSKPLQYFEGTLQLRDCSEEVMEFVHERVENDPYVHIAKEKRMKNGVDLYVSSNKFLRKLGKALKNKFGGIMQESVKLFSKDRQSSKEVYRVTVLFRMLPFKVGETIDFQGEKHKVMGIKEKVTLKNLSTGKSKMYKYQDMS